MDCIGHRLLLLANNMIYLDKDWFNMANGWFKLILECNIQHR